MVHPLRLQANETAYDALDGHDSSRHSDEEAGSPWQDTSEQEDESPEQDTSEQEEENYEHHTSQPEVESPSQDAHSSIGWPVNQTELYARITSIGSGTGEEGEDVDTDGNADEEKQVRAPTSVGFFHPTLKHVRHEVMIKWAITTTILFVFIFAVLSVYWGALLNVDEKLSTLVVYIVDFDGQTAPYNTSGIQPLVGPTIVRLAQQIVQDQEPHLGYGSLPPENFEYDPIQVRQAIYNWNAWAAIIINANATALLHSAIQNVNSSYDPMGACQLVYVASRDDTNWSDIMFPHLSMFMTQATSMVGEEFTRDVMHNATTNNTLVENLARVPQALSPAIGFSQYDLRPFYPFTAIPAVSIGLIYLIIMSFFSFAFYLPIHQKYLKPEGHPPLKFTHLIIWRWCSTISAYFLLSLAYSLVSLAFQINFSGANPVSSETSPTSTAAGFSNRGAYGHGTFPVYWMINFFGMIALGLICENVAMFVGHPWASLWLIFWVITNVSTGFYDIDVESRFYHWGYVWPLHYIVEGSRQILFDLHSRIGLDFGVLIAWGGINTAVFPVACWFMRWKSLHHVREYYR